MLKLKPEDIIFFDKLQKDYDNTINYYNDLADHMKSWQPAIIQNKHFLIDTGLNHDIGYVLADEKNKVTINFIEYIFRYFENNYGLSSLTHYIQGLILNSYIKYQFTDYKGKFDKLHYNQIIKDICERLQIDNFNDAEINDLKQRIVQKLKYYWEHERIIIKDNKIKITDFGFDISTNWNNLEVNLGETTVKFYSDVISSLNYINTGNLEIPIHFKKWLDDIGEWRNKKPLDQFYKLHKINILGVASIRFYKNRSIELKFNDEENKNKFVRVLKGDF